MSNPTSLDPGESSSAGAKLIAGFVILTLAIFLALTISMAICSTQPTPMVALVVLSGVSFLALLPSAVLKFRRLGRTSISTELASIVAWCFTAIILAGLASSLATPQPLSAISPLAMDPIMTRATITAAVVSLYFAGMVLIRHYWILDPMLHAISEPDGAVTRLKLLDNGFLFQTYGALLRHRLDAVEQDNGPELMTECARVYAEAAASSSLSKKLEPQLNELRPLLDSSKPFDAAKARAICRTILIYEYQPTSKTIVLTKIQNQLFIFAIMLLAVATTFGILGWGAPMLVGASAAIIARASSLSPLGSPENLDGGPRWMALLVTPLIGAVASVIGLLAISGCIALKIFSTELTAALPTVPDLGLSREDYEFAPSALVLAAAFGWSSKLLDKLLNNITDFVGKGSPDPSSDPQGPIGNPGGRPGGSDDTPETAAPATTAAPAILTAPQTEGRMHKRRRAIAKLVRRR